MTRRHRGIFSKRVASSKLPCSSRRSNIQECMSMKNGTWCVLEKGEYTNLDRKGRGSRSEGSWWWTWSNMFSKILKEHIETCKCVYAINHENVSMSTCLNLKEKNSCLTYFVVQLLNFSSVNYPSSFYTYTFYVPLFSQKRFLLFPNRYWNLVNLETIY